MQLRTRRAGLIDYTGTDCTEVVVQEDVSGTEVCLIAARTISIASGTIYSPETVI